jgi:hypothetical protein
MKVTSNAMAGIGRLPLLLVVPLLLAGAFLPRAAAAAPRNCAIADIASLKACLARPNDFDIFTVTRDLACTTDADCCGADATPLLRLQDVADKVIDGAGHILRRARPLACSAIEFDRVKRVTLRNLSLDETNACRPATTSTRTARARCS